jgi:PAS domain S-box-containing protein
MASYPVNPPERFGRLRELLDVSILTLAVLTLTWLALLRPVLYGLLSPPILVFWAGVRPALDAAVLALVLRVLLLAGRPPEARPLLLLGGAGLVILAGDLMAGYRMVLDGYLPGTSLDTFWIAGALVGAWAGLAVAPPDRRQPPQARGRGRRRAEALLPIAFTYGVVGFTVLDAWLTGAIDRAGLAVSVALSVLLVARQGVVAGQSEMHQYASLLNASADMAFICETGGKLRLFNPAFAAALGVELKSPGGLSLAEFMRPETKIEEMLSQVGSDGWAGEVSLRRRDGLSIPTMLTLKPVEGLPGPQALVAGTGVDLTVIKARETELRLALHDVAAARSDLESLNTDLEHKVETRTEQLAKMVEDLDRLNQDLKELDKLKSEFVALVSHELRAPLTNIRSGLELLLAAHPSLDDHVRESLSLVEEEATRLSRFVEAILDLSSLEAGKFPLRLSAVSLEKVAQVAVDRFRGQPAYDRIQVHLPPEVPEVTADERVLGSVFFHLLDNAAKYGGSGPITIQAEAEPDGVEVQIDDRGPGIPEGERQRIFERFHRLDSRDSRETYGHGLGLHLVKRMLEAMGGSIRAEGNPEQGARLAVWLPRADADEAEPTGIQGSGQRPNHGRLIE